MKEKIKVLYTHKKLRVTSYVIGGLFILGLTFQLGVLVGYHKANFARNWGDHYNKNFGMERPDSMRGMMHGKYPTAHGAAGKVVSLSLPTFVILDRDGTEKNIIITNKTVIKNGMNNASSSELKSDSMVMVLGDPTEDGKVEAKLIRIMPFPFSTSTTMHGMMNR